MVECWRNVVVDKGGALGSILVIQCKRNGEGSLILFTVDNKGGERKEERKGD